MTTEEKAQALVDAVRSEYPLVADFHAVGIALSRAIEQHEAFRQEVSDAVSAWHFNPGTWNVGKLMAFIIPKPKPDPLLAALLELELSSDLQEGQHDAKWIRNKLDELGFEIREKNDGQPNSN